MWERVSRKTVLRGKALGCKGACRTPNLGNRTTQVTSRVDLIQILQSDRCGFELWLLTHPLCDLELMASLL